MSRRAPVIMATLFMDIRGKVALMRGSAKRIGREIAIEFARRGARIAVHYRSGEAEAKQVAGRDGAAFHADLRDGAAIENMFRGIEATFGGLDILINSASVFSPATADDATPTHWDLQIDVNAKAPGPVLFPDYYTEEQKRAAIDRTLLKRAGSPQDIVNAVMFLIENDYITGEIIHVDGGRHII